MTNWPLLEAIMKMLDRYEDRLVRMGTHDNLQCQCLWLKLYGDGSGYVMAEYSAVQPTDTATQRVVRTVCSMAPSEVMQFDSLEELYGEMVSRTMGVRA